MKLAFRGSGFDPVFSCPARPARPLLSWSRASHFHHPGCSAPLLAFDSAISQGCASFSNSALPSVCPALEKTVTGPGRNRAGILHFSLQPLLGQALILQSRLSGSPIQMYLSWSGSLPWRPETMSPFPTAPSHPCWAVLPGQGMKVRATRSLCTNVLCFQPSTRGHRSWLYSAEPSEEAHTKKRKSKFPR